MSATTFKPDPLIIKKETSNAMMFISTGLIIGCIGCHFVLDWSIAKTIMAPIALIFITGYMIFGIRKFNFAAQIKVTDQDVTVTSGKFEQVIPIKEIQEVSISKNKRTMTFKNDSKKLLSKALWGFNGEAIKELILAKNTNKS